VQVSPPVAPATAEYELVQQSIHVLGKEATKVVEYLPAVHSTQELAIVAAVVVMSEMTFRGLGIWDLGIMTRVGVRKLGEIDGLGESNRAMG
jgi:hypothetical protein